MINVRIPKPCDLRTAITLYYENMELSNKDIEILFGKLSSTTVSKLKKLAHEVMAKENVPLWNAQRVNTQAAYKAWGLDINDLKSRYKELKLLD